MVNVPMQVDVLWPEASVGPWLIRIWWRAQHGVLCPVGLQVTSWVDDDDLRSSGPHNSLPTAAEDVAFPRIDGQLLRTKIPWGEVLEASRAQLVEHLNQTRDQTDWPEEWRQGFAAWQHRTTDVREAANSGRRGRDLGDDHYREVAQVYAAALRHGDSPTKAVSNHFHVEKSTAAKKVARARERGFLPPTTQGRAGPLSEEL